MLIVAWYLYLFNDLRGGHMAERGLGSPLSKKS